MKLFRRNAMLGIRAERAAAGVAVQRASGVSPSEEAGEASKKNLAVTDGTAGDCKRRCDALQASQRDDGKELSGVVQRLARAVSSVAQDAVTIRQLEDELEAGQTKCHALNPSGTCSCRRRCPACVRSFTKRESR